MNNYLSLENYDKCFFILTQSLADKFQYQVPTEKEEFVKKALYFKMKEISKSELFADARTANQSAIKNTLESLTITLKLQQTNKPSFRNLDRDKMVYGDRELSTIQFKPHATSTRDNPVDKSFELIVAERSDNAPSRPTKELPKDEAENSLDLDAFNKRLSQMESDRVEVMREIIPTTAPGNMDINQIYKQITGPSAGQKGTTPIQDNTSAITHQQHDLIARESGSSIQITKYLTINGFDRDWTQHQSRFAFPVSMLDLSKQYKNISSMQVTCMIIPMEIIDARSLINMPKSSYLNSFKISFPYLMCCIDEINDVYDGLNNQIRRSFANFVVDTTYRDDNGRGYAILKPIQREIKSFYPNPLSGLQKLTFSIQKPNGALFNKSRDDFKIKKIEYDDYNKLYIKVVLDKFYDKNEFFIGDTIMMREYQISPPASDTTNHVSDYNALCTFLNRAEGHEIMEIGKPNESGFYQNFYVYAPNKFNETIGQPIVEKKQVDALRAYNIANPVSNKTVGSIINMSLQCVISMHITLSTGDAGIVRSELV